MASSCVDEQFDLPKPVEALQAVRQSGLVGSAVEIKLSACGPDKLPPVTQWRICPHGDGTAG